MSCPAPEQLAAAATEADDAILAHSITCAACLAAIEDQRALRALAQRAPAVVLTRERREAMAAELMAQADQLSAITPPRAQRAAMQPAVTSEGPHGDGVHVLTRERRDAMGPAAASDGRDADSDGIRVLTRERRDAMAAELMAKADEADSDGVRVLTRERRDAMAAELMAKADEEDALIVAFRRASRRRRTAALVIAGLAAAAALVLVVATRGTDSNRVENRDLAAGGSAAGSAEGERDVATVPSTARGTDRRATDPRTADPRTADPRTADARTTDGRSIDGRTAEGRTSAKIAGTGDYVRDARVARSTRDVVRLRGGELTVDTTGSRPVEIISGSTAIAVTKARIKVVATRGVVSSVAVFAGSAEVTVDGHRVIVEAGTVWERDVARDEALAAFRTGWTALRVGDNAAAIAAFDRATDPIVAEDATYWSAIASERSGDTAGATRRYRDLLTRFPQTTRATEARSAITRLEP